MTLLYSALKHSVSYYCAEPWLEGGVASQTWMVIVVTFEAAGDEGE